ncbi:MAG: Tol-Pal system beta propeller repeat protein TolB [Rickettsiaceae bacterium]|nr:Tol-Pal system beta propeller repeat protein TolB [Rickettsiaceae bacterium]
MSLYKRKFLGILILIFNLFAFHSEAIREITITEGHVDPIPIAINKFSFSSSSEQDLMKKITEVISHDLGSSSYFKILPQAAFIESEIGIKHKPLFASWRQIKAQILLNGHIYQRGGTTEISFIIWDSSLEKAIHKEVIELPSHLWRRGAHKIADTIYERVTGDKGYFDTRIAYVSESYAGGKKFKRLAVMDFDGNNHKFLTDGKDLVLTPRFSPDANKIIYISYQKHKPQLYLKDLKTGRESPLGGFPGISFAPRFSPDGRKALFSIANKGSTNIFEIDLKTKKVAKLTNNFAINTSPSYSPDGRKIVFNSDRSGSRQIYVMNSDGSNVERISFGSGIYATPVWSPKGDYIAFTKIAGGFTIGVMRSDGSDERSIASGYLVEGPTWSPSGRLIMFSKEQRGYGREGNLSNLYYIDLTGNNEHMVYTPKNASDPEWSSLLD